MIATVRNRRGVIAAVEPFDGQSGRLHLVQLEYQDDAAPSAERVLWELEPRRELDEPLALPRPDGDNAMPPREFDALLRAARWTALSPYLDPSGLGPLQTEPLASPFHGSVRVEDYQLMPLLKALRMPRVSLLIADDVGLGKTVEAGLILTEMLLRRRIRRVLVLTPASLRQQWREELWEKFSLRFDIIDRQSTEQLRRRLGMDANPWASFSRIVASYHYLRQPDVREQFLSTCRTPQGSPHLPWDLLIVDECHNLMPSPFGKDSDLCETLRVIAPAFEHRLFLSATPHNGHTRSFTGLLEILDPVRFTRTSEMTSTIRGRIENVVVRRLKREINARSAGDAGGDASRFCNRLPPQALQLTVDPREAALAGAFDGFRSAVRRIMNHGTKQRQRAGAFAVEILGKRLLSCPTAFAESWRRAKQGFTDQDTATERDLSASERALRQETGDDRETHQREAAASTVVGAWLKNFADEIQDEIDAVERALADLGFVLDGGPITEQTPLVDARFDALAALIERLLMTLGPAAPRATDVSDGVGHQHALLGTPDPEPPRAFRAGERLVVFTEYKTTLDYVARRLRERLETEHVLTLFGSGGSDAMNDTDRENVKAAFNNPDHAVRVLVATDAASEGLNLHRTARYLLHYDCPWNPSRLEQRNGRLDRYGQARDVTVHHFFSDSDPDLRFLDHVVRKADEIREDLGSVNEIFDRATHRRLILGEDAAQVQNDLDRAIGAALTAQPMEANAAEPAEAGTRGAEMLEVLATEIDLDPSTLGETLETAMGASAGTARLQAEAPFVYRVSNPDAPGWRDVIDETVRRPVLGGVPGPMPRIAFSTEPFIERLGNLSVFRPRPDLLLMHLAHPLMQRALAVLTRRRYPGDQQVSRWTVRRSDVPADTEALVLLSIEELAVNDLRETFHRWVRTLAFPVRNGALGDPLPHVPAAARRTRADATDPAIRALAGEILEDASPDLQGWLRRYRSDLTQRLRSQLETDHDAARRRENDRYRQRQGEVSQLIHQQTLARLTREIQQLNVKRRQGRLFDQAGFLAEIDQSLEEKQAELRRRREHYDSIREQLQQERSRVLDHLLPARFSLAGDAQVLPVTAEIRLAETK